MTAYPPELVDAVAAELARHHGSKYPEAQRIRARLILDLLDREGALYRTADGCGAARSGGPN